MGSRNRLDKDEIEEAMRNFDSDTYFGPSFGNYSECSTCEGTGQVKGWVRKAKKCPECDGEGYHQYL